MTPPGAGTNYPLLYKLAAVITVLASLVGITVVISDGGDGPSTVTIKVDGPDRDDRRDDSIEVPERVVDQAERSEAGQHDGLKDESSPLATPGQLADIEAAKDRNRKTTEALPTAGATANVPGCRTRFVRNQSSRGGVRPQFFILHYTVSPNRPGRSDVDGITAYFNRSSSGASSHFVIDAEGNCNYIVPIENKAWTAAGMNPFGIQVEVIATGRETRYLEPAGYAKLAQVAKYVQSRTGIPVGRRARVVNCRPGTSGTLQHADGGGCAGGHHDIGPFPLPPVIKLIGSGGGTAGVSSALRKDEVKMVTRRCYHRLARFKLKNGTSADRAHLRWGRYWLAKIKARRAAIRENGLTSKYNRKKRHYVLGAYAIGKVCR